MQPRKRLYRVAQGCRSLATSGSRRRFRLLPVAAPGLTAGQQLSIAGLEEIDGLSSSAFLCYHSKLPRPLLHQSETMNELSSCFVDCVAGLRVERFRRTLRNELVAGPRANWEFQALDGGSRWSGTLLTRSEPQKPIAPAGLDTAF